MLNETYSDRSMLGGQPVAGVITISGDEYSDLIRAAAQLDAIIVTILHSRHVPTTLIEAVARERNINMEVDHGNREKVLLDEAERELHDVGHD